MKDWIVITETGTRCFVRSVCIQGALDTVRAEIKCRQLVVRRMTHGEKYDIDLND